MKPTVALNMLTRNAARSAIRAIESTGPLCEVTIIDTGSTDGSKEILRDYLQSNKKVKRFTIVDVSPEARPDLYVYDVPESFSGSAGSSPPTAGPAGSSPAGSSPPTAGPAGSSPAGSSPVGSSPPTAGPVGSSPPTAGPVGSSPPTAGPVGLLLPKDEYTGRLILADFAGARQEGLAETISDFVFFLDSDDVIKSGDAREISQAACYLQRHKKNLGITPYAHRFPPGETPENLPCSVMARASLGRVGIVKWEGAVHERLVSKKAAFGEGANESVAFEAPLTIDLFDRNDPGSRVPWRNLKILCRSYEKDHNRSGHILFHLGLETRRAFPEKSLLYFKKFIERCIKPASDIKETPFAMGEIMGNSIIATAYVECGRIYEMAKKPQEAFEEYEKARQACSDFPEAYFGLGRISYEVKSYGQAVDFIEEGLRLLNNKKSEFFMHDPTERKGKSRIFLALSLAHLGHHKKALSAWKEGKSIMPREFATLKDILDKKATSSAKNPKILPAQVTL